MADKEFVKTPTTSDGSTTFLVTGLLTNGPDENRGGNAWRRVVARPGAHCRRMADLDRPRRLVPAASKE